MGVDGGPSTGAALLVIEPDGTRKWMVFQCDGNSAFWLIQDLYSQFCPRVVGIEAFVESNKRNSAEDAELTRKITEHAYMLVAGIKRRPVAVPRKRRATDVKPWATDKRLEKAGFPLGRKFLDARDAGRHALYAAVYDGKERDPLA